jgi:transposase-like protein
MRINCPECKSNNIEADSIDNLPTSENAQIWLCKDCLSTFYTEEKAVD